MKHLYTIFTLLFSLISFSQNDSLMPNLFGEYRYKISYYAQGQSSLSHYPENYSFIPETGGEDTIKVILSSPYTEQVQAARLWYKGDSAMIKQCALGHIPYSDEWEVLYDYSREVGEYMTPNSWGMSQSVIEEIDTVAISGHAFKRFHLYNGQKVIKGIGNTSFPFYAPHLEVGGNLCEAILKYNGPGDVDSLVFINEICPNNLSVDKFSLISVEVFPNPASAFLVFKSNDDQVLISTIRIFDLTGTQMDLLTLDHTLEANINVSMLSSGSYFYSLETSNGLRSSGKFVIINR